MTVNVWLHYTSTLQLLERIRNVSSFIAENCSVRDRQDGSFFRCIRCRKELCFEHFFVAYYFHYENSYT
jgi:hypothetical protein